MTLLDVTNLWPPFASADLYAPASGYYKRLPGINERYVQIAGTENGYKKLTGTSNHQIEVTADQ